MREKTGVEDGDDVLDALTRLGDGPHSTEAIAAEAKLPHVRALVVLGKLGKYGAIVYLPTKRKNANPNWRLLEIGEEGFEG